MPVSTNAFEQHTDVLIVGAGPTGLALGATLRRAGVTPVIVEKLAAGQNTSRAAVIHAHTLDVLQELGIDARLVDSGLKITTFSLRDRDRLLARLRFDQLPTSHAYLLMLPQDRTERILHDGLTAAGGEVRWGTEVQSLVETETGVRAVVTSPDGPQVIYAKYVVGADGMRSIVRTAAGIGFTGSTYEESFVLADVEMQWSLGRNEVMLFFSPDGLLVVAPLPDRDRFRIVATFANPPEEAAVADIQALLDTRGPSAGSGQVRSVLWSSRFRIHHRVADRYRRGRFFLVGDAAHVHSPAGGQGMNTGLVDAHVLGRLLADVIAGRASDADLDRYDEKRRPAAVAVLKLANRLTRMATMTGAFERGLRNIGLRLINLSPIARRQMQMNLSGLSRRAAADIS